MMKNCVFLKIVLLSMILSCWLLICPALSRDVKDENSRNRHVPVFNWKRATFSSTLVVGTVSGIYLATRDIYYDEATGPFHFSRHPDGKLRWFENEDRGMDKLGHIFSTSLFSQNIYFLSQWSGMSKRASSWTAVLLSLTIMTGMELHDAQYKRWGFSLGDEVGNILGAVFPVAQHNIDIFQHIEYKYSYNFLAHKSPDAEIQDYENMTFWVTVNPKKLGESILPSWFPGFLNLAAGVSITGGGTHDREILVAIDYNLKNFRTSSPYLNHLIDLFDRFHFPAPAVRITPEFILYGFYF